ncbi:MAG: glycosyltransferase family 2 protein [bacterium]
MSRSRSGLVMKFSLVIPVYNGGEVLKETLASVRKCDPAPDETIVVDDGSTDETASIASSFGCRVIPLQGPLGPATARSRGAEAADGDVIVFTDADVLLPEDLFAHLQEDFAREEVSAVQGIFSRHCPFTDYCSDYKNLYNRFVLDALPDWIETTFTSLTAVRRDSFFASGGFDCNIRTPSVEDRTLGRNLTRFGASIFLDRRIEVVHNKRLTLFGFMRNQFRRSRDLAKLLLRNRQEKCSTTQTPKSFNKQGRFGTNAPSTMARIPVAYLGLLSVMLTCQWCPWAWIAVGVWFGLFVVLALPFTGYLARQRGWMFALAGLPLNLLDALVSGAGVAWGVLDFVFRKNRY